MCRIKRTAVKNQQQRQQRYVYVILMAHNHRTIGTLHSGGGCGVRGVPMLCVVFFSQSNRLLCSFFSVVYIKSKIFTLHKHSSNKYKWLVLRVARKVDGRKAGWQDGRNVVSTFGADAMIYCLQQKPTTALFVCCSLLLM